MKRKTSTYIPENLVSAVMLVESIRNGRLEIPSENTTEFLLDVKKKLNAAQAFFEKANRDPEIVKYLNDLASL